MGRTPPRAKLRVGRLGLRHSQTRGASLVTRAARPLLVEVSSTWPNLENYIVAGRLGLLRRYPSRCRCLFQCLSRRGASRRRSRCACRCRCPTQFQYLSRSSMEQSIPASTSQESPTRSAGRRRGSPTSRTVLRPGPYMALRRP